MHLRAVVNAFCVSGNLVFMHTYTYYTYDVTGRVPDGPCDQISAGYQVLVVELSYTLSLLPWGAHA